MDERCRDICERLSWAVYEYEGDVELEKHSPAGEDFTFSVGVENFVSDVKEYAADFDPDEHVLFWLEAKRRGISGVPTARELIEDADEIGRMLQELAAALEES